MKALFNWTFKKFFLPYYLSQQNKPVTHKDLDFAFTDMNGARYYQFSMNQSVPMKRLEQLKTYMTYMELKMSAESMDLIIDKAVGFVEAGIKEKNNAARCAALLLEIKDRNERIVPSELIYNYLAILYIREDEDPMTIDNDLHMEKVEMFKAHCSEQDGFFFHLTELKRLFNSLHLSPSEWEQYLNESRLQGEKLLEKVRIYSSETL